MSDDMEIRAVEPVNVTPVKADKKELGKYVEQVSELARKASDVASSSKRDLESTLDRVFDVFETPNAFQVFWVIALLVSVGIFVLSALLTVSNSNTYVVILSSISTTLLFIGLVGYLIYRPKSFDFSQKPLKAIAEPKELRNFPGALVDTKKATDNYFGELE